MSGLSDSLPSNVWQALLRQGRTRRHPQGDVLLRQGEKGNHVLLLTSGRVKVTRVERDGREWLLAIRGPGEALGEVSVWDDSPRSATVTALDPCVTYVISASVFRRTMGESATGEVVLRHVLARLREGEEIRAELVHPSSTQRVVRVLVRLGTSLGGGTSTVPTLDVGLSQEELARAVGLSRSAFAAELRALRRDGLITTGRQRVVLRDVEGLRALIGEAPYMAAVRQ
jgi:CRP/FNR family transcriptional regulator, cyclic AMP receptor protein